MELNAKDLQALERRLHESLGRTGGIIPQTVEQVEWAERHVDLSEVVLPVRLRDPSQVFARIASSQVGPTTAELPQVFGHFVSMLRRKHGFTVEALATKAQVETEEICRIEVDSAYEPRPRTVTQLAKVFGLSAKAFARLAHLTSRQDDRIAEGAVRFAACAKSMGALTDEQRQALKDFVKLLNSLE